MAKNPFPYFNFYTKDWLSSHARATMNAEQRGIYIDLLAFAWQSEPPCTLPSDPCELALLAGMGGKWWADNGPFLMRWFIRRGKRLVNVKLYHTFTEAMTFRALKSEAGKAGNAKRWKNHEKEVSHSDAFATRKPIANVSPASASAKASSNTEEQIQNPSDSSSPPAPMNGHALDPELREAIQKASNLHSLLDQRVEGWWKKLLATYEPMEELYVFEELSKADVWLEANPGRKPHGTRGMQRFIGSWFVRASDKARTTAAKMAATRRLYATQAPKRTNYGS